MVCLLIVSATRSHAKGDELPPVPRRFRNRLAPDLTPTCRTTPPRLDPATAQFGSNPDRRRQTFSDPCAFPVTANLTVLAPLGTCRGGALDAAGTKGGRGSIVSRKQWQ